MTRKNPSKSHRISERHAEAMDPFRLRETNSRGSPPRPRPAQESPGPTPPDLRPHDDQGGAQQHQPLE